MSASTSPAANMRPTVRIEGREGPILLGARWPWLRRCGSPGSVEQRQGPGPNSSVIGSGSWKLRRLAKWLDVGSAQPHIALQVDPGDPRRNW